jgi:hypothetical protein
MEIKNQRENFTTASFRQAVEKMHGCKASWVEEVPVKESFKDETVWDGTVHVFDLTGHPEATRAYAWSLPMPGSSKHRFFAVLKLSPVFSPRDAVRAAIVQEYRTRHDPKR